jgi:hypothetical protein
MLCATDDKGGHFCARSCAVPGDCPPHVGMPFESCSTDPGGRGQVCRPVLGVCHGPSAIPSITGTGQVCAGCRVGVPGDCATGLVCYQDSFTRERFCTPPCTVTISSTGTATADSCPTGSYCDLGGAAAAGTYNSVCAADPSYASLTCYP